MSLVPEKARQRVGEHLGAVPRGAAEAQAGQLGKVQRTEVRRSERRAAVRSAAVLLQRSLHASLVEPLQQGHRERESVEFRRLCPLDCILQNSVLTHVDDEYRNYY